jgi:hypothetical protein
MAVITQQHGKKQTGQRNKCNSKSKSRKNNFWHCRKIQNETLTRAAYRKAVSVQGKPIHPHLMLG